MSTYLLVDVHNLAHRCLHATQGTVDIKSGMALHITFNALRNCWRNFKADHIVFCTEGRSWRHKEYSEYKARRIVEKTLMSQRERDDLETYFATFDVLLEFITEKTNATVLNCPTAEADDMIARWIQLHPDDNHIILSTDRDFYQLLSDNVKIYDGVKGWTIGIDGVFDENNKPATVTRNVVTTKVNGKAIKKPKTFPVEAPDPEYELFMKIIRGDVSDNIMSAYPGVRENGSSKKPGIREAFDDREKRGYNWNNFMQQTWDKLIGTDDEGNAISQKVRVLDEFNFNKKLIDLTQQPDEVRDQMDASILEAIDRKLVSSVGVWFLRFVNDMALVNIAKYPNDYANMLAAPYKKIN